jgi:hypothetical protein
MYNNLTLPIQRPASCSDGAIAKIFETEHWMGGNLGGVGLELNLLQLVLRMQEILIFNLLDHA